MYVFDVKSNYVCLDNCTTTEYYLRPSSTVILRHIRDELVALAQSSSLSNIILSWGLRQGRAISNSISRILHDAPVN